MLNMDRPLTLRSALIILAILFAVPLLLTLGLLLYHIVAYYL